MFNRYTPATFVREILLILTTIVVLFPFYLLVVMALKDTKEATVSSPVAATATAMSHSATRLGQGRLT